MLSHLSTQTTFLRASKGARSRDDTDAVDANNTSINVRAESHGPIDVLRKDSCHKTIFAIVATANNIILVFKFIDYNNGSKYLVLVYGSVVFCVGKNGWFDKISLSESVRSRNKATIMMLADRALNDSLSIR